MKPTRVFLSVQPVRSTSASRNVRYRASWWTRGTSTELYRSKIVSSQEEAVELAQKWLARRNQEPARVDTQLIDTTNQPERFGYAHETHEAKSPAQLDAEIAVALARERS
jgi:hypothetical protein